MQDDNNQLNTGQGGEALDLTALQRRRLLMKSLGKGSAVLAGAALPLASFAAPSLVPTTNGNQCTVSGFKSAVGSRPTVGPTPCGGFTVSHFVDSGVTPPVPRNWPAFTYPVGTAATPADLKFSDLFGPSAPATKVIDILATNTPPNEAIFVAAYFSAFLAGQSVLPPGRVTFPYAPVDVVGQYANGAYDPAVIDFYRLVLQTP
jgi:hypothetical protein